MLPEQVLVNDLELAVIRWISDENPALQLQFERLEVVRRELTSVGSYTDFRCEESSEVSTNTCPGLHGLITIPTVPSGLGAVLFCHGRRPKFLELFTFGSEMWDGKIEGFEIEDIT